LAADNIIKDKQDPIKPVRDLLRFPL